MFMVVLYLQELTNPISYTYISDINLLLLTSYLVRNLEEKFTCISRFQNNLEQKLVGFKLIFIANIFIRN